MASTPSRANRILYVEDDATSARLAKLLAEKEGDAVDLAGTAAECLKAIAEDPPDLLLLDLTLPDGSGLDLLRNVRERWSDLPSIIVTASDSVQDVIGTMRLGAVDYLTKPIDSSRTIVSIAIALKLKRQEKEIARLRADVSQTYSPEHLVGRSEAMEGVRKLTLCPSSASPLRQAPCILAKIPELGCRG